MTEQLSIRDISPKYLRYGATTSLNHEIPDRIAQGLNRLPLQYDSLYVVASTGFRKQREVVVFRAVNPGGEDYIIKVGRSYDEDLHGTPIQRGLFESSDQVQLAKTPLSGYVVPSFSLVIGDKNETYDVRVQRDYIEGKSLVDLKLRKLSPNNIKALLDYHKALLGSLVKFGIYPDSGIPFNERGIFTKAVTKFLRLVPTASENTILNEETGEIKLVDSGYPYGVPHLQNSAMSFGKKAFIAAVVLGEMGVLSGMYLTAQCASVLKRDFADARTSLLIIPPEK